MRHLGRYCWLRGFAVTAALVAVLGLYGTAVTAVGAPLAAAKAHWVQVRSPDAGVIKGLSCSSPSSCLAVGFANNGDSEVAEAWNGHAWRSVTPAAPAGSTFALFEGVDCTSSHMCVAVGGYDQGSDFLPLAEKWNGSSWKRLTTSSVGSSSGFNAVSCPNSSSCWAVGTANSKPLAEHWTGHSFATVSMVAKGQDDQVNGISCRAGSCVAVGGDTLGTLTERSTGKGFSVITGGSTPSKTIGDLWAVSCVSAKHCVAAGESDAKTGGAIRTLTEVYNGKRFKTFASPDPTHLKVPYNSLYGISCTSSTNCWAAGEGGAYAFGGPNPTSKDRSTDAVHWNGKRWSVVGSANPNNKPSGFLAISCSRASSCMAGGLWEPTGTQETLIEKLKG